MKKLLGYLLVVGTIASTSCSEKVEILKAETLSNFPSGSSLALADNKLVVIGDDASQIIVVDTAFNIIDSVPVWKENIWRIAKDEKPDYEASEIIVYNGKQHLLALGSGSGRERSQAMLLPMPLSYNSTPAHINLSVLYKQLTLAGNDVNIEGAAMVGEDIILANRAHQAAPINKLFIISQTNFFNQMPHSFSTLEVEFPATASVIGISGLHYLPQPDLLVFTATTEATANHYDDGEIGDSYIGMIEKFSTIMGKQKTSVNKLINLSKLHPVFYKQKIESLAIDNTKNANAIIYLVADNDDGATRLFSIRMPLSR